MFEMTPDRIFLIGLIASALVVGIRFVFAKVLHKDLHKGWITVMVAAVSVALAIIWQLPTFGPIDEPMAFLGLLTQYMASIVGAATMIYNILLSKVLDKLFPELYST